MRILEKEKQSERKRARQGEGKSERKEERQEESLEIGKESKRYKESERPRYIDRKKTNITLLHFKNQNCCSTRVSRSSIYIIKLTIYRKRNREREKEQNIPIEGKSEKRRKRERKEEREESNQRQEERVRYIKRERATEIYRQNKNCFTFRELELLHNQGIEELRVLFT